MENDLISRKALLDTMQNHFGQDLAYLGEDLQYCQEAVQIAPSVEAEPVWHGRWEWYEEERNSMFPDGDYGWRCSNCKQDLAAELALGIHGMHYAHEMLDDPDHPPTLKRCLFCGAKMDAKEEHHAD